MQKTTKVQLRERYYNGRWYDYFLSTNRLWGMQRSSSSRIQCSGLERQRISRGLGFWADWDRCPDRSSTDRLCISWIQITLTSTLNLLPAVIIVVAGALLTGVPYECKTSSCVASPGRVHFDAAIGPAIGSAGQVGNHHRRHHHSFRLKRQSH